MFFLLTSAMAHQKGMNPTGIRRLFSHEKIGIRTQFQHLVLSGGSIEAIPSPMGKLLSSKGRKSKAQCSWRNIHKGEGCLQPMELKKTHDMRKWMEMGKFAMSTYESIVSYIHYILQVTFCDKLQLQ